MTAYGKGEAEVPISLLIFPTHIEMVTAYGKSTRDGGACTKKRRRSFWFSDMIAMNETIKRIKEGSLCDCTSATQPKSK